jgi:predicted dehydrogenase
MIRVGIVGLGFMGWIHWLAWRKVRGVRVTAVCDRKPGRLRGDWRGLRGNFGPPGEKVDLGGAIGYLDWRDLLRDPAVDVVDITLPTAFHAEAAIVGLAAGKHVLCEKPMALSSRDCRRMIRAAERAGRMLLVAHVLPFFPEYAWALKVIRSGKYGPLIRAWFKREISEPTWLTDYWSADKIGGPMFDLHVHDAHFARLLFGMPRSVHASGNLRAGVPKLWSSFYRYSDRSLSVSNSCGVRDGCRWSFNHGYQISLRTRYLKFDFALIDGRGKYFVEPQICYGDEICRPVRLRGGGPLDAFTAELRAAVRCVRTGAQTDILSPTIACDAVRMCEAEAKSIVRGRTVPL